MMELIPGKLYRPTFKALLFGGNKTGYGNPKILTKKEHVLYFGKGNLEKSHIEIYLFLDPGGNVAWLSRYDIALGAIEEAKRNQ